MTPHTTQNSVKKPVYSRENPPPPISGLSASYPWPRKEEGVLINVEDPNLLDYNVEGWDKPKARAYNTLLGVNILPTRFVDPRVLASLGLDGDVCDTLTTMGIADICYTPHVVFPELVRQALASTEVQFEDIYNPTLETASFTFMAVGKLCSLPLTQFNEVNNLADVPREVNLVKEFAPTQQFWKLIATGDFKPRSANQSLIRNPSIRIIAKGLSNLLFVKDQTSKVTNGELQMLYSGLEDQIRATRAGMSLASVRTNRGYLLAGMFSKKHTMRRRGSQKKDREPAYSIAPTLRDSSQRDQEGHQLYCLLPQQEITRISVFENIRFLPEPKFLCADPRATPPDVEMDDTTPDEYDLGLTEYDADADTYRRWMIDSQHKNNSLMKRILRAITGGCFQSHTSAGEQAHTPQPSRRAGK
ncbi:hypothetical protein DY000_02008258 [Brassica cretica]|uniref:Arabidopsis retrotransposon Orf1 C-terminal domain-containing protein n=1 Tax=Brassica cretica TaxID=69181 RepID=A0ABQ7CEY2_BRACR|nr:hypothetical protein DY000_02008258 [Brassica cretica]